MEERGGEGTREVRDNLMSFELTFSSFRAAPLTSWKKQGCR